MAGELKLSGQDRVLVLAPHPDDETLAAGDLIRAALAVGATLRVVFATDGDNNPWPQRWLERRWRIGAGERARWGARRRREALAALALLGVGGAAQTARFLGWPDQGLTALLMRDDAAVDLLTDEIARFAPTHIALPTLGDRHPDHSALRVLADLAVLRAGGSCRRLGYLVHGERPRDTDRLLTTVTHDADAKRRAMAAHTSQLALSRRRLLELAALPNRFEPAEMTPTAAGGSRILRIARASAWSPRRRELLLVIALREEILRVRAVLPLGSRRLTVRDAHGRVFALDCGGSELRIALPEFTTSPRAIYAKIHRRDPRLLIFDREHWRQDADLQCTPAARLTGSAESGYI